MLTAALMAACFVAAAALMAACTMAAALMALTVMMTVSVMAALGVGIIIQPAFQKGLYAGVGVSGNAGIEPYAGLGKSHFGAASDSAADQYIHIEVI